MSKWDVSKSPSMRGIVACNKAVTTINKEKVAWISYEDKEGKIHLVDIPKRMIVQLIKRVKAEYVRFLVDEVTIQTMKEVKNGKEKI
jgi:hypothetical protein